MKAVPITWFLLIGLLLQSVVWVLPSEWSGQAQRLVHDMAHAIDHGHHQHPASHDGSGHDIDAALLMDANTAPDGSPQGTHHAHASEGVQLQGLPVAIALTALAQARSAPHAEPRVHPPSVDPDGLFRPPQCVV